MVLIRLLDFGRKGVLAVVVRVVASVDKVGC